jgi:uncharacterized protein (TIGR03435 family)
MTTWRVSLSRVLRQVTSLVLVRSLALLGIALGYQVLPITAPGLAVVSGASPEDRQGDSISFAVSSVKSRTVPTRTTMRLLPNGRFSATNATLKELIQRAYGEPDNALREYHVLEGPDWIGKDRFDIEATVDDESRARPDSPTQMLLMLRTLLEDRFHLRVRLESRPMPTYALVLARSDGELGEMLRRSDVDCRALRAAAIASPATATPPSAYECLLGAAPGALRIRGEPITRLAQALTGLLGRPVTDKTGLSGNFNLDLAYDLESAVGLSRQLTTDVIKSPPKGPAIPTALREQLGLRLESREEAVDVVVIVDVQPPSPN